MNLYDVMAALDAGSNMFGAADCATIAAGLAWLYDTTQPDDAMIQRPTLAERGRS